MLIRILDGVMGDEGVRGKGGRKRSSVGCGGIECLNFSWVGGCMMMSCASECDDHERTTGLTINVPSCVLGEFGTSALGVCSLRPKVSLPVD